MSSGIQTLLHTKCSQQMKHIHADQCLLLLVRVLELVSELELAFCNLADRNIQLNLLLAEQLFHLSKNQVMDLNILDML